MGFSLGLTPLHTAQTRDGRRVTIGTASEHGCIGIALMVATRHGTFQLCRPASAADLGKDSREYGTAQLDRDAVHNRPHLGIGRYLAPPKSVSKRHALLREAPCSGRCFTGVDRCSPL